MKIKAIDSQTKKPVVNTKIQLQVRGKDSGFVSCMTDSTGCCQLDDKYRDQQICCAGSTGAEWVKAAEGVTVIFSSVKQNQSSKSFASTHTNK